MKPKKGEIPTDASDLTLKEEQLYVDDLPGWFKAHPAIKAILRYTHD